MIDLENKLTKLETDLAAIKEKVSFFSIIYEKFDKTLDKLDERTIDDRKEFTEMIGDLQFNIMAEIKALREDMAKQHAIENKKIEDINTWRWLIMGGAAVIGWIVSKMLPFK